MLAPPAVSTCHREPNFLYIGTSKAGSTWVYALLCRHPRTFMVDGKGLYYFDGHYERGQQWYLSHFQDASDEKVVGEISHSYLSSPVACRRIADLNPEMKLMVCLRNPADRAFSAYLDRVKNGKIHCSFEQALEDIPSLTDRGRYATHLRPYLDTFGPERIHVALFDELAADSEQFADKIFRFLDIQPIEILKQQSRKMMPAARPRSRAVSRFTKQASSAAKAVGLRKLRSRVKTSRWIRNMLYRQYTPQDKPAICEATRHLLRERFAKEVHQLDQMLDGNFAQTWGY